MSSSALLQLNVRELALVYEQMHEAMNDEDLHISEQRSAEKIFNRCAELMGREEGEEGFPNEINSDDGGWNRY